MLLSEVYGSGRKRMKRLRDSECVRCDGGAGGGGGGEDSSVVVVVAASINAVVNACSYG